MRDRIIALLNDKKLTAIKFAELMEVQPSSISHIISGRNNPSFDFIAKLLEKFDDINPDWIILGKGNMYRTLPPQDSNTGDSIPSLDLPFDINSGDVNSGDTPNDKHIESHIDNPLPNLPIFDLRSPNNEIAKVIVLYKDGTFEYFTLR